MARGRLGTGGREGALLTANMGTMRFLHARIVLPRHVPYVIGDPLVLHVFPFPQLAVIAMGTTFTVSVGISGSSAMAFPWQTFFGHMR